MPTSEFTMDREASRQNLASPIASPFLCFSLFKLRHFGRRGIGSLGKQH